MIASRSAKMVAASTAFCVHAAALWAFVGTSEIRVEGDAGSPEAARLGSSFADMAAGTLSASPPLETTPQTRPDEAEPDVTAAHEPHRPAQAGHTAPTPPVKSMAVAALPADQAEAIPPDTVQPAQPARPSATPPDTPEVLSPADEPNASVTRSKRPRTRSAEFEKRHEPAPPARTARKEPGPKAAEPQPHGNSNRNARAGAATGSEQAKATAQSRNNGKSSQSGNAAASNYPGKVMRRISQVPKPRVGRRGTAVVSFTVGSGGTLAAISLARSSGSGELDQAALRVIRRAAPFPAPPPSARRNFTIRIQGG